MSENQQHLVSVLYSVHDQLRIKRSQTKDDREWLEIWREHTSDLKTLQEYSKAMHDLATKVWEPRNSLPGENNTVDTAGKTVKLKCRLEWVVRCCLDYFRDKFVGGEGKEKLRLLDVGSCYNPFSKFENYFDIIAVDLCPAPGFEGKILKCDFLEVKLIHTDETETGEKAVHQLFIPASKRETDAAETAKYKTVEHLPTNYFDVVVFSYFLEYLADSKQRVASCRKAYDLLTPNGLLFILRPDSSKVTPGGNNALVKKMKVGMAVLGFKRLYFEKLEHLWCMAFKKMNEEEKANLLESSYFKKDFQKIGVEFSLEDFDRVHELFCISQDFKHCPEIELGPCDETSSSSIIAHCDPSLLEELPNFEVSAD